MKLGHLLMIQLRIRMNDINFIKLLNTKMNTFQPMLATPLLKPTDKHDDETIFNAMKKLRYPVLASVKMDGIRALKLDGKLVSRRLKLIPSVMLRSLAQDIPNGFDMEIWHPNALFNDIQSAVMSEVAQNPVPLQFNVIDWYINETYEHRLAKLGCSRPALPYSWLIMPIVKLCSSSQELFDFEKKVIEEQGEGICFRTPDSPYKQGRSTLKEQYLVKLARFIYEDVTIVGFKEMIINGNQNKWDGTGHMNRSTSNAYTFKAGSLGAFIVKNSEGITYDVGTGVGLTDDLRMKYWDTQDKLIGKTAVVKHKPCGRKIKPRNPVFWGMREDV
jgi:DNA ligase 1